MFEILSSIIKETACVEITHIIVLLMSNKPMMRCKIILLKYNILTLTGLFLNKSYIPY